MIGKFGFALIFGVLILFFSACQRTTEGPVLTGPYLGQPPPGMHGEVFAPGIMSTSLPELNAVFFPDGRSVIYSVQTGHMKWALVMIEEENGSWSKPEVAPFSDEYGGVDPFVSYDGKTVYYCSNRPRSDLRKAEDDYDIWYVKREGGGWSEPVNMGPPVNSEAHEFYPSLTRDGTLYFQSHRDGGIGSSDIYRARRINGTYLDVELLPEEINSTGFEGDAYIGPDEDFLILSTRRDFEHYGGADLYISFRGENDSWSPLRNMGPGINSSGSENCQILSPCGKYLFYTSRQYAIDLADETMTYASIQKAWTGPQNGYGDIYWIDARIIEDLRFNPFQ